MMRSILDRIMSQNLYPRGLDLVSSSIDRNTAVLYTFIMKQLAKSLNSKLSHPRCEGLKVAIFIKFQLESKVPRLSRLARMSLL